MSVPITVRCECGQTHSARLGDEVSCECGRRYDTSRLPPHHFGAVIARQARIRLYMRLGAIFILGAVVFSALMWGAKGIAVALPLAGLLWFIYFGRWFRKRWLRDLDEATPTMQLEATNE